MHAIAQCPYLLISISNPSPSPPTPTYNQPPQQIGADSAVNSAAVAARAPAAAAPPSQDSSEASTTTGNSNSNSNSNSTPPDATAAANDTPLAISWRGARSAFGSGAFRVAILALAALAAASALVHQHTDATSRVAGESVAQLALGAPGAEAWQLGCAALGFLMYKVAILGVGFAPGAGGPGAGAEAGVVQFENERKAS